MAENNPSLSIEVKLQRFVEDNRSHLPAVVEVAEGIYGTQEKDSEVRDFSKGDILRLLSIKEEVNITFDAVYSEASKKGLITVDKDFSGAQFKIVSSFKDGHIYESVNVMISDFPEYLQAIKNIQVDGVSIKKGDRLKLMSKRLDNVPCIQCKLIRTSETIQLSGDLRQSFAKKLDKSHEAVNLFDIYNRLPQRVRLVHDMGQTIRGLHHGIKGLDPHFDGELNLSKIEIVEACIWENPDKIISIPLTTEVYVYPRKDWGSDIGPLTDIHDLAKQATLESPKMAVVVDPDSVVPGCTKDTLLSVFCTKTVDYGLCEGKNKTSVLIPSKYPSKFKVCAKSWCTVEDLLRAGVHQDVRVGTTVRFNDGLLDDLYENDVVNLIEFTTENFCGTSEDFEVVQIHRDRSGTGRVGTITVPTFARANFYENSKMMGDIQLSQILGHELPCQVTLSRPNLSQDPNELDINDDLLLRLSPLEILGKYKIEVTLVNLLKSTDQHQSLSDYGEVVVIIPEVKKLAVRSITRNIKDFAQDASRAQAVDTKIMRISKNEALKIKSLNVQIDSIYSDVPPPIPHRHGKKTPTRPSDPKPLHLTKTMDFHHQEQLSPPLPPKCQQVSPSSQSSPRSPINTKSMIKRLPGIFHNVYRSGDSRRSQPPTQPNVSTENPYNTIKDDRSTGTTAAYEVTLPPPVGVASEDSDEDDYEKPGVNFEPPTDGNLSSFNVSDMVMLLKHLEVNQCIVTTFANKNINGKKLCVLKQQHTEEGLRQELGVDNMKDWYTLRWFIDKSV